MIDDWLTRAGRLGGLVDREGVTLMLFLAFAYPDGLPYRKKGSYAFTKVGQVSYRRSIVTGSMQGLGGARG